MKAIPFRLAVQAGTSYVSGAKSLYPAAEIVEYENNLMVGNWTKMSRCTAMDDISSMLL